MEQLKALGGRAAWTGADLRRGQDGWRLPFSKQSLAEIDAALRHAQNLGLTWDQVTAETFPLDVLAGEIAQAADELENGRGVVQFKGLPVGRYDADALKTIFFGVSSHLGRPVYQSAKGELLGEIRDEGADVGQIRGQMQNTDGTSFLSSRARAQSAAPLRWHTDRTDVVGLLAVGQAAKGGDSRLSSAVAIHDTMIARRPDLAALHCDRRAFRQPLFAHLCRSGTEAGNHTAHEPHAMGSARFAGRAWR